MAALTADWVRLRAREARVTCSCSATATKMRSCSSVMFARSDCEMHQGQAEAADEEECGQAEQQGLEAFRFQLADIRLEAHGGERHRKQERRRRRDERLGGWRN